MNPACYHRLMPEAVEIRRLERRAVAADTTPEELIRVHERALFLRAYPASQEIARRADALLASMASRVSRFPDRSAFEAAEVSGIAGSSFTAVFSYEVARSLTARYPGLRIDWEAYDEPASMGPVMRRIVPLTGDDWPVEAHTPFQNWMEAVVPRGANDLGWLLNRIARLPIEERDRADLYDSMALPLYWELGDGPHTRTNLRLNRPLFLHDEPLLRRQDVSLQEGFRAPRILTRRLPMREARRILDIILDTSAMRYRELYGFSHPDAAQVRHADLGRGTDFYFFGVPPAWRLPIRAYHAGMFFKNGVPAGYVELLSLFDRSEIGFNLYYTFREGETAWLYARLVALFHQLLGSNTFVVDPYQVGLENDEAIESGAVWFYRKLGFRPVRAAVTRLVKREERRMAAVPGYRSTATTLRKLAAGPMILEGPEAKAGLWDRFEVRTLGMALASGKNNPLARFARTKSGRHEAAYIKEMQQHPQVRDAVLRIAGA